MTIPIAGIPTQLNALDTYTRSATTYLYTYKYSAPLTVGTKDLKCRVYVGEGWTTYTPRPCAVLMSTLGFAITSTDDEPLVRDYADFFVRSGCVFIVADSRVQADNPTNPDDAALGITGDLAARTVNALIDDCKHLYQWVTGVRALSPWCIEPKWVFPFGASAGAMGWLFMCQKYPWLADRIPGLICAAVAYGYDANPTYETAIRSTLGYTEADHDAGDPPVCAFLGGADTILGVTRIADFKAVLDGLGAPGVVHYDADGGHETALTFDLTALTNAATMAEAMKDFIDARTAVIERSRSCLLIT